MATTDTDLDCWFTERAGEDVVDMTPPPPLTALRGPDGRGLGICCRRWRGAGTTTAVRLDRVPPPGLWAADNLRILLATHGSAIAWGTPLPRPLIVIGADSERALVGQMLRTLERIGERPQLVPDVERERAEVLARVLDADNGPPAPLPFAAAVLVAIRTCRLERRARPVIHRDTLRPGVEITPSQAVRAVRALEQRGARWFRDVAGRLAAPAALTLCEIVRGNSGRMPDMRVGIACGYVLRAAGGRNSYFASLARLGADPELLLRRYSVSATA